MTKKRLFSALLAVVMGLSVSAVTPAFAAEKDFIKTVAVNESVPDGYTGITSVEELNAVRNNLEGKYILMNDIDVAAVEDWKPIGTAETPFTGVFNGNGYSISNITITDFKSKTAGLFGTIGDAIIANVNVENINVKIDYPYQTTYTVGAVAGSMKNAKILNCSASGKIDVIAGGTFNVGGIVGYASDIESAIVNCLNKASINLTGKLDPDAFSYGVVVYANVGGIAGVLSNCVVARCINEGNIIVNPNNVVYAGGICGDAKLNAPVGDCGNTGDITVSKQAVAGGICGRSHILVNCFNTGKIAFENVLGEPVIAGIAGKTHFVPDDSVKPVPGYEDKLPEVSPATVENCYYIDEYDIGIGNGDEGDISSVKALSKEEFANKASFAGFDFAEVWTFNNAPVLKAETNKINIFIEANSGDTVELDSSIVYAISNNKEIVSVESDLNIKCNSSGTTSIETINADGDFAILEISVVGDNEDEPKSIFDKIAIFFASVITWFISIFN